MTTEVTSDMKYPPESQPIHPIPTRVTGVTYRHRESYDLTPTRLKINPSKKSSYNGHSRRSRVGASISPSNDIESKKDSRDMCAMACHKCDSQLGGVTCSWM